MEKPERRQPAVHGSELTEHIRALLRADIQNHERGVPDSLMQGMSPAERPLMRRDLLLPLRGVRLRQLSMFTRELSILIRAGMPVLRALHSIGSRTNDQKLQSILYRIGTMIENGQTFWGAMAAFPRTFNPLYVATVRSGELSGRLAESLLHLADHTEREFLLRRKAASAAVYPAIVLLLAVTICVVLATFIAPVFAELLEGFDAELPILTRAVMGFVSWLPAHWYWLIVVPVLIHVAYRGLTRLFPVRLVRDRVKLSFPVTGTLCRRMLAAKFARTFAILFESGINILEALAIAQEAVNNEAASLDIGKVQKAVEEGRSLEEALKQTSVFPPLLIDMMTVGEQAGTLPEVLPQIASLYEEEVNIAMNNLATVIEPLLILATGILVAGVFYAFFVPYLRLISAISGL